MKQKLLILIFTSLVIIDQLVKKIFIKHATINSKFIFGYGQSFDLFFWITTLIIIILGLYLIGQNRAQKYSLILMAAGATSNLIDRIFRGGVVDYLSINLKENINFNLADLFLILGFFSYLYFLGRENEKQNTN